MKLAAVLVRERRFHRPADASRGHARARAHAWWQRLRRYNGRCIAGFAILCRIYWHSSARVKAPLDEGQARAAKPEPLEPTATAGGCSLQAALLGEHPSRDDDRPDSLRFLRLARGGHPYAADPAAPSVADGHDCRRYGQPGQQAAEIVAAVRRIRGRGLRLEPSSPGPQAFDPSSPVAAPGFPSPESVVAHPRLVTLRILNRRGRDGHGLGDGRGLRNIDRFGERRRLRQRRPAPQP